MNGFVMDDKTFIKQPNHVSTARFILNPADRFTLTALEKNIIYTIIDKLQKDMSKDLNQEYKEQEVTIELRKIDKNNNYSRVKKAVKSLGAKHVEFKLSIPGTGKIESRSTNLISGIGHVPNSKLISFTVPSHACRFFCYIGGGFTSFQKTIAISLSSIYSKFLYELCCRWIDKGGYSSTIEGLKEYLSISDKYGQIAHLRNKVLDVSVRELKQKADLYFSYSLKKEGRKYTTISIKIHRNSKNKDDYYGVREDHYAYVYMFLNRFFPNYTDTKALDYSEALASKGNIDKAYYRFIRLDDEFSVGKKNKIDICNLLKVRILPELGVKIHAKTQNNTQLKLSVS